MNDHPDNRTPLPRLALRAGQVVGGRYRVQGLLGRGGMGVVYAATHELTQRRVALKVVDSDGSDLPALRDRFLSEARTAAAVRHPNIVDVLDMGMHLGSPYLVMELLDGRALDAIIDEQRELPHAEILGWLFPVMGALCTLHDAGIVHRDIKPSNIFLNQTAGQRIVPKLLDFGLARAASDARLTRSGVVIGTPLYMAPEHAAGGQVGPAADVWSMGVVLFECITGAMPFSSTDRSVLAAQVLAGHVRPIRQVRPDVPPLLAEAVDRALQRDLGIRHSSMRALVQALVRAACAHDIVLPDNPDPSGLPEFPAWRAAGLQRAAQRPAGFSPETTSELFSEPLPLLQPRSAPRRPRRHGLWAAVLVLTGLLAAWLYQRSLHATPQPLAPTLPHQPAAVQPPPAVLPPPAVMELKAQPATSVTTPQLPREESPAPVRKTNERTRRKARAQGGRNHDTAPDAPGPAAPAEVETEWK